MLKVGGASILNNSVLSITLVTFSVRVSVVDISIYIILIDSMPCFLLSEVFLNLVALLDVSLDEFVCDTLALWCVLANENGLHAEVVKSLQVREA